MDQFIIISCNFHYQFLGISIIYCENRNVHANFKL